jgi:hypothetical protein
MLVAMNVKDTTDPSNRAIVLLVTNAGTPALHGTLSPT